MTGLLTHQRDHFGGAARAMLWAMDLPRKSRISSCTPIAFLAVLRRGVVRHLRRYAVRLRSGLAHLTPKRPVLWVKCGDPPELKGRAILERLMLLSSAITGALSRFFCPPR